MKFLGVIPARYQSSRFLGKPLVEINGISMIERTYKQSIKNVNFLYKKLLKNFKSEY